MIINKPATIVALLAAMNGIGGCAGVRPRESFPQVSNTVEKYAGYELTWHDGSDADRQADEMVADLLRQPLTAESAVRVALLNNHRLQATYEELGIAQADLVSAGLLRNPIFDAAYRFGDGGTAAKIDLGLTFDFVDILFLHARKQIAEAELEATKARVISSVLDVIGQTRSTFYAAQADEQAAASAEQLVQAADASADFAKRLREAGNVTALRLLVDQAAQAEAKLRLTQTRMTAADSRERLNRMLGAWGRQTDWTIASKLAEPSAAEPDAVETEKLAVSRSLAPSRSPGTNHRQLTITRHRAAAGCPVRTRNRHQRRARRRHVVHRPINRPPRPTLQPGPATSGQGGGPGAPS